MGRFDQLLQAAGIKPQHKAPAAKPKKRFVVMAKALPANLGNIAMPESLHVLRYELELAVNGARITAIDARDILHQLSAGETLPTDLAEKLKAVLKVRAKRTAEEAGALRIQLARGVKDRKITATEAAKVEHLINVGAELPDDMKIKIGKYAR
ncbi:hypothetical protein [Pseudomonas amygdali]|uniref:hypothetical protein n=1 Tax=Pseudomonas amygdali TaxID=47877 RepID=UPI001FB5F99D|nr:hypothetical protein [Pseudomonas amygdali]UPT37470.1 hypothetical protein LT107_01940 [Pseudomonas amygdali pv. loropetali]